MGSDRISSFDRRQDGLRLALWPWFIFDGSLYLLYVDGSGKQNVPLSHNKEKMCSHCLCSIFDISSPLLSSSDWRRIQGCLINCGRNTRSLFHFLVPIFIANCYISSTVPSLHLGMECGEFIK